MKKRILLSLLGTVVLGTSMLSTATQNVEAIFLGNYQGQNLADRLKIEGHTAYIDNLLKHEIESTNVEINSKKDSEVTFRIEVPTWVVVTAGSGEWIERIAGNNNLGVPGYTQMYYGKNDDYNRTFEVRGLSIDSRTKANNITTNITSNVTTNNMLEITASVKLNEDVTDTEIPLEVTADAIELGTTVVDPTGNRLNPSLEVQNVIFEGNGNTKLDLGTVNVAVKADTTTSSSTTPSTSTSSSSSTTPSTSTSSSSSTTPSTSTSSSSSTTPSTSTSSSSTTTETSSVMNTEQSTSPSTSTTSSQAKTPVIYTPSEPSTPSITSTSSTSEKFRSTASASTLPKTGEKQSIWITLMGIVLLGASMFYFKKNKVKNK
ncbi:hypothetical protein IGJ94_002367 [Enterococcus sp. AZ153]|uniref:LPXTG cell wall anchor domain-containing protein n=1 Tax=unclassified Enterococcus TaxID=2608891 RepID=UPI003F24045B